jgi:hypothetical protein
VLCHCLQSVADSQPRRWSKISGYKTDRMVARWNVALQRPRSDQGSYGSDPAVAAASQIPL